MFESGVPTFFPSGSGEASLALTEHVLAWADRVADGDTIEHVDTSTLARVRSNSKRLAHHCILKLRNNYMIGTL